MKKLMQIVMCSVAMLMLTTLTAVKAAPPGKTNLLQIEKAVMYAETDAGQYVVAWNIPVPIQNDQANVLRSEEDVFPAPGVLAAKESFTKPVQPKDKDAGNKKEVKEVLDVNLLHDLAINAKKEVMVQIPAVIVVTTNTVPTGKQHAAAQLTSLVPDVVPLK